MFNFNGFALDFQLDTYIIFTCNYIIKIAVYV